MSNKRRQFIDRLLRISEINQQLLDIGDKGRQPAFTKRIKLVQMGTAQFNMPPNVPVAAPRHNCKILVIDKLANRYSSEGHRQVQKFAEKNQSLKNIVQKPEVRSHRRIIEKRKSTDSHLDTEYQINFVSPIEMELKNHITKHVQEYCKRPQSCQKARTATSSKTLAKSDVDGQSLFSANINGKNMLSGKSIKFNRANTLNFEKDKKTEEERRAKIQKMKQINKNYGKPFTPPPKLTARSYIVCEVAKETIKPVVCCNSKNSQQVASLTKIMTCIVTLEIAQEYRVNLDEECIRIGKYESSIGGTTASIRPGQIYTVRQLLYGLMLPSGNDASLALAVWGGRKLLQSSNELIDSERNPSFGIEIMLKKVTKGTCYTRFIKEMNEKARVLDMNKTKYANSHGLSNSSNKSTAFDVAVLSNYAMKHPTFREIVSCKAYSATIKQEVDNPENIELQGEGESEGKQYDQPLSPVKNPIRGSSSQKNMNFREVQVGWQNTHRLVHTKSNQYIGIKTGITPTAGPCLSSMITIQKRQFIIIVLGCHKTAYRFKQTQILKKWLFKHLGLVHKFKKTASLKQQKQTEEGYSDSQGEDFNTND